MSSTTNGSAWEEGNRGHVAFATVCRLNVQAEWSARDKLFGDENARVCVPSLILGVTYCLQTYVFGTHIL